VGGAARRKVVNKKLLGFFTTLENQPLLDTKYGKDGREMINFASDWAIKTRCSFIPARLWFLPTSS
jgi:hypothetical protein